MIDERQLREMLERRAETISATPTDEPKAIRRARQRLARNATVGGLVSLVVVAGALAGLRTIQATPTPVKPATPPPSPAGLGSLAYGVDGDIYVADRFGANPLRIADGRPPKDCGFSGEFWGEGPIWSPDGRYLAYRHRNCETPRIPWWHVVISDPQGNVVAEFPGEGWDISWSPDSTRVAVWVNLFETIGIYGLDGVRQAVLTVPPEMLLGGDHDPVWLPDGESLMLPGVVIPIDGSAPYKLPLDSRRLGWVTYSPDGSRVAYLDGRSLVVAEADGSNPQEVLGEWVWRPVWSPTGDRIAFTSQSKSSRWEPNQLRVLDVATGTVSLLTEAEASDMLEVIDFSPEGDRVFFSKIEDRQRGPASLWSVKADGFDPRRLVTGAAWGDWLSPS